MSEQQEILGELEPVLREYLALGSWGRILVSLAPNARGDLVVADLMVEEILGDEAALEATFESQDARQLMPVIARAAQALCGLSGVSAEEVGGATFVLQPSGSLAFLPGLVRAPSPDLDRQREALTRALSEKNQQLKMLYGIGGDAKLRSDNQLGQTTVERHGKQVASGRHVVLASYSQQRRSFVWGAHNPSLSEAARETARKLLDTLPNRSLWEISTPGFTTDEPTAWLLAALVASEHGLSGVARVELAEEGFVLLGFLDLQPAAQGETLESI